jgi:hypothetical protein
MNEPSKLVRSLGVISVAIVAIVAAVVSYAHMQAVAEHAGEGWRSWLEPFSVDGLLIGASLVVYVRRRSPLAWLAVAVGLLVSLAANLAAAEPILISRLVSAWPAIALALSYETLLTIVRHAPAEFPTESEQDTHEPESTQDQVQEELTDAVNGRIFADTSSWANLVKEGK